MDSRSDRVNFPTGAATSALGDWRINGEFPGIVQWGVGADSVLFRVTPGAVPRLLLSYLQYCPGTGGSATADLVDVGTSSCLRMQQNASSIPIAYEPPASVGKMTATIRSSFGLTIKDLAGVLRVERPTVYSWLRDDSEPNVDNRERLQSVFALAKSWMSLVSSDKKPDLKAKVLDGKSLLEYLKEEHLRNFAIGRVLRSQAQHVSVAPESEGGTINLRERASSLGIRSSDSQEEIDIITGRRFSLE